MSNSRKRGWIDNKIHKKKFVPAKKVCDENASQSRETLEGIAHISSEEKLPSVIGNEENWENFKTWISDSNRQCKSCLVLGNTGIGKTSGVNYFAKELGFVRIEISGSDIKGPHQFSEDLREALSRKSLLGKIALIVEDIDGLEEEYAKILKGFIKNPGNSSNPLICTTGNILPSSLLDIKSCMNCLYMKPPEYAKIISYGQKKWNKLPYKVISTNANLCKGDIRQFNFLNELENAVYEAQQIPQNTTEHQKKLLEKYPPQENHPCKIMRIGGVEKACSAFRIKGQCNCDTSLQLDKAKIAHCDKFTLAKKLLYSQESIETAEKAVTTYGNSMCNMLHENYLYAIQSGRMIEMKKCAQHVERLSDADVMRSGNLNSMLQEAKLIFGSVAFGSGQKKTNPTASLHFTTQKQKSDTDSSKSKLQLALNKII